MRRFACGGILGLIAVCLAGCGKDNGPITQERTTGDDRPSAQATRPAIGAEAGDVAFAARPSSDAKVAAASPREAAPTEALSAADDSAREPAMHDGPWRGDTAERRATADELAVHDGRAVRTPAPEKPRRREQRDQQIQSGTLTAGSYDDVAHFDSYREFLSQAQQQDTAEELPRLAVGDRALIEVRNGQSQPLGGVRVQVYPEGQADGQPLADLVTASDGRTMFLSGQDDPQNRRQYRVRVEPGDGAEPVWQVMHLDQTPWQVTLETVPAALPTALDLALVIDTTGSMGDELEYLKVEIESIAQTVRELFPHVDQRFALVVYRDQGDTYVTRTFDFTDSLDSFRADLSAQSAGGGGDYPEAVHLALEQAAALDWRQGNVARALFLVADAPPHDRFAASSLETIGQLRDRAVRLYPVASSGVALKAEFVLRAGAFLTLGQYLFLTDHSGVGNPHATPHVPEYQVERLDRLMVRMIASELAGKRLAAEEIIAIEGGQ